MGSTELLSITETVLPTWGPWVEDIVNTIAFGPQGGPFFNLTRDPSEIRPRPPARLPSRCCLEGVEDDVVDDPEDGSFLGCGVSPLVKDRYMYVINTP